MFIMLMKRRNGFADLVMVQQNRRCPGILSEYQIHVFQNFHCPESEICEIAYGCGNNMKHGEN
jgi:hypothetical protein